MQTRSRRAAALTLTLLLAMGTASTCQAGKRGADRPFKGHARGIATFLSPVEAIIDYTAMPRISGSSPVASTCSLTRMDSRFREP